MSSAMNDLAETATDVAANVSKKLKSVGVDTDTMAEAAKERAGDLQKMIVEEIARRPWQALALAAFVGYWYGHKLRS